MDEKNSERRKQIDLENLRRGPTRHATLAPELVERIIRIKSILVEVDDSSLEEALDDFKRDAHPEKEVAIWERMASVYRGYVLFNRDLTLDQKRDVYAVLLSASMGDRNFSNAKHLDRTAITTIVHLYDISN